jgi:tight adherence protein B
LSNLWVISAAVFVAVMLGVQAIHLVFFRLRSTQKAINHRLALSKQLSGTGLVLDALRRERGFADFKNPTLVHLNDLLMQTGLKVNRALLSLSIPGATLFFFFCFGLAIGYSLAEFLLSLVVATSAVVLFLHATRARRMARFAEQLPDALDVIVRGVRAGHPFSAALGLVAREMPDPIGTEFGMTSDEIVFGLDVRTAIENLHRRTGQQDLLFFVIAVNIQTQTGGSLAEILLRLSRMIRSRSKLRLKIRALTAEGRLSAIFLSLMPFVLVGVITLISPGYYAEVRHHPVIVPALILGLTLLLMANVILYRMVNVKF